MGSRGEKNICIIDIIAFIFSEKVRMFMKICLSLGVVRKITGNDSIFSMYRGSR